MEFDDVRAFVAVVNMGSISLAARDLNVTQSAVTRRLQRLETSLGTTLLDRKTRPVMPTDAGQAALERCRRLLHNVREVQAAASNSVLPQGEIRIGVAHALSEFTLMKPVDEIRREFPKIGLRLSTGWSRQLLDRVRSRALDAALVHLPEGERLPVEVAGSTIGKDRLVVVASRQSSWSKAKRIRDLKDAQWILNPEGCSTRSVLRRTLLQADIDMVVAVEAYDYGLQLSLVAQDRGLSLVPERILARSSSRSRLRVLRISGLEFPITAWMVHCEPLLGLDTVIARLSRLVAESL